MKAAKIFQIGLFIIFAGAASVVTSLAQRTIGLPRNESEAIRREVEAQKRREQRFYRLENIGKNGDSRQNDKKEQSDKPKPTRKDLDAVVVSEEDKARFAEFLKQPHTGIVRLHDIANCDESQRIYNVEQPCPAHIDGKGGAYSFVEEEYQTRFQSDITLDKSAFRIQKAATLGFLTELGDKPLEGLNADSEGIREMADFMPSVDKREVMIQRRIVYKGFQVGKYVYKSSQALKENSTYALRSIAYRVESEDLNLKGRRADVIVIFRVVRSHEDGSVTILWKELQRKTAPKLVFDKSIAKTKQNSNNAPKKFAMN